MPKRATAYALTLPAREPGTPAHRWLYSALRGEILAGRLRPGARLPGTRDLAAQYGLSRGTIVNAFDQLKAEGYVDGSVGSGTYVSKVLPEDLLAVQRTARGRPAMPRTARLLSDYGRRIQPIPVLEVRPTRAFRLNMPALELFPTTLWAQITARRLRRMSTKLLLACEPLGYLPLREAVADYLVASRGVRCGPDQVVIVSGVQEALDLVARLLLNPGDRAVMEDPGYRGSAGVFAAAGAKISALAVDDEGMKVPGARDRGARVVYVTPAHQFPLGVTMSLARRLALLAWARQTGALIFEDDYDSEFRYAGRPVPALQGIDRDGLVLFAGSFNKVLFPSLRMGYLVVPPDLAPTFAAARTLTCRHPPLLEQASVCDFITEGHFGRHLRRMREVYAERLSVLQESVRQHLAGLLELSTVEAGLHTVGWLRRGVDAESVARAAAARNVEIVPLSTTTRGRVARHAVQLGFSAVDAREIRRGVRELAAILEQQGPIEE